MPLNIRLARVTLLTVTTLISLNIVEMQSASASCTSDYLAAVSGSGATQAPSRNYPTPTVVDPQTLTIYGDNVIPFAAAVEQGETAWDESVAANEIAASNAIVAATGAFRSCVGP